MTDDILQMWSKRGKSSPFAVAKFGRSLKVSIEKLNNPFILLSNFVHNESLNVKTCRGWKIEHCRQYIITLCLRIQSSRVLISITTIVVGCNLFQYRKWTLGTKMTSPPSTLNTLHSTTFHQMTKWHSAIISAMMKMTSRTIQGIITFYYLLVWYCD